MKPADLISRHGHLLMDMHVEGPILDLACGEGQNGMFFSRKGFPVIYCDRSDKALARVAEIAKEKRIHPDLWKIDLEKAGVNPLLENHFGAILVFRYLHRPLMPCIKKAIKKGGLLFYETFTMDQRNYGRPCNSDYLLQPGELLNQFGDWHLIHYFEGIAHAPERAVAQLVCQKI